MIIETLRRWRSDPVAFVEQALIDPETGKPFQLYEEQKAFLQRGFTLTPDGRLPYPELVFSAPKKSGKTSLAAMATIYTVVVLGGPFAEGYCLANDEEQSKGRVFQAIVRILEASPVFAETFKATQNQVIFPETGATITALASDYAGAAGGNPTISVFDELWAYTSERAHRLWDEMVPPPTRKVATRLTVTYAGFEGESTLLEGLYKRGMTGRLIGTDLREIPGSLLMYWTHELRAPWQTKAWAEQMKQNNRPNAYLRLVENRWVTGEERFIPIEWWDACCTGTPVLLDRSLPVVLGVDAGLKRDSAAIVATTFDQKAKKVRLVAHRVFYPQGEALDLEETVESAVLDFADRFNVRAVRYDPWQFARSAQTLQKQGIPMEEFPQTPDRLTAMGTNLYELLKGGNLIGYADEDLRAGFLHAVAKETPRGFKITKEKASEKIDVVVALAMSALGAVELGKEPEPVAPEVVALLGRASLYESVGRRRAFPFGE